MNLDRVPHADPRMSTVYSSTVSWIHFPGQLTEPPGGWSFFQGAGENEDRHWTLTWNHIVSGASPNQGS